MSSEVAAAAVAIAALAGDPVEPNADGLHEITCWSDYVLTSSVPLDLPQGFARQLSQPDDEVQRYLVNFGDYIGRMSLPGVELLITSSKLDAEGFDRLLQDISCHCAALPFDFNSPSFVPYERESLTEPDLLYHAFVYLRWALWSARPSLTELLAMVERDPHRTLVRDDVDRPVWEARDVTARALELACSRPDGWRVIKRPDAGAVGADPAASARVRRVSTLPIELLQVEARATFDTPENRFLRYFMEMVRELSERVAERFVLHDEKGSVRDRNLATDAERIRQVAAQWMTAPFLSGVGRLRYFPASSQVLQNRVGYRELLRHYLAIILATRYPIEARDLQLLMEVKSASLLYEYWTFFTVADALRPLLGDPVQASEMTSESGDSIYYRQGVTVRYPDDTELSYNRSFPGNGRGSYSLAFRPDITLRRGSTLHLFDAKFRVDHFSEPEAEEFDVEADLDTSAKPPGWFKHADIHKMHAYRDAIGACRGAETVSSVWVLYPGTEFVFYDVARGRVLELPEAFGGLSGVGAIPLMPGQDMSSLTATLGRLLG
jgi:uncharacterized protein